MLHAIAILWLNQVNQLAPSGKSSLGKAD